MFVLKCPAVITLGSLCFWRTPESNRHAICVFSVSGLVHSVYITWAFQKLMKCGLLYVVLYFVASAIITSSSFRSTVLIICNTSKLFRYL